MDTKVTFLMMAYNSEQYIEKAVNSILNQSEKSVNIIIRNNGSTDKTGEILDALCAKHNNIYVMTNKINCITDDGVELYGNGWWYDDENMLGDYISIIDSDDWLDIDFTKKLYEVGKNVDADIVFAGNYFVNDDRIVGKRIPPKLKSSKTSDISNDFDMIHGSLRTWWGKIFKKSFFLQNYDYAWKPKQPLWWCIDTSIMLSYFEKSTRIASIEEPLYFMKLRETSAYSTRDINIARIMEADSIYYQMMRIVHKFNIDNEENINYIENVHWGYLQELIDDLPKNINMTIKQKYEWLENIFLDEISGKYLKNNFSKYFFIIKPVLDQLKEVNQDEYDINECYLQRINAFIDMVYEDDMNPLAYSVLMGALCDKMNRIAFGIELIDLPMRLKSKGAKQAETFDYHIKRWWTIRHKDWVNLMVLSDEDDEIRNMRCRMYEAIRDNDEKALDIAIDILIKCPADITALIYVSQMYEKFGNKVESNLLMNTVKILWEKQDIEYVVNLIESVKLQ